MHPSGHADPAAHRRARSHTELLEPQRVAGAIALARRNVDYVIVDLHPSYSPLNRAMFDKADRILIPLTPDLPAIRAVVKLRDVADELGMRDRLPLIINRANSGISLEDIEQAVGHPDLSRRPVRGLVLVKAQRGPDPVRDRAPRADHARLRPMADRLWASRCSSRRPSRR